MYRRVVRRVPASGREWPRVPRSASESDYRRMRTHDAKWTQTRRKGKGEQRMRMVVMMTALFLSGTPPHRPAQAPPDSRRHNVAAGQQRRITWANQATHKRLCDEQNNAAN